MNNVLCMTFQNIALGLTGWPVLANALPLEKFEKARHIGGGHFELTEPYLIILLVHCTGVGSKNVQSKATGISHTDSLPMDTALLYVNVSDTIDIINTAYELLGISSNCHKVNSLPESKSCLC